MDKEAKKYQDIGFTIRTIYDAIGKGIADLDDLQRMFIKALGHMPKECLEDIIVLLEKGAETKAIQAIGNFIVPDTATRERRKNITSAFVAGLTGQDPDAITVDLDQEDMLKEADAAYAEGLGLKKTIHSFTS